MLFNKTHVVDELNTFLSIASVSANLKHKADILRCANYLEGHLTDIGLENVRQFATDGHPIVYGEWLHAPGKPTVLFYGHYDVQPPEPLELWVSPPFEPTIRDGYLYARGVSDDKGQVFCHLKAIEALLKKNGKLPVNIKVLIEGEEEIGSVHLAPFVEKNQTLLGADVVLISDTPMFGPDQPSLCTSLRGLVYLEVEVEGCKSDLHSGQQGGAVPNPIQALAKIISNLKDDDQRITIPGFYDQVLPDRVDIPFDEEAYRNEVGAEELVGEAGYNSLERRWLRPTLECNGIVGGYIGPGAKTVIPSKAMAKISMRLVANQNPDDILFKFKAYIRQIAPKSVRVSFNEFHPSGWPVRVKTESVAVQAAMRAIEKSFGRKPIFQGEGGTVPVVADFQRLLGLQSVLMGFNLPNDGIHAPNERFSLDRYYKGIHASAYFFEELGQ